MVGMMAVVKAGLSDELTVVTKAGNSAVKMAEMSAAVKARWMVAEMAEE